MAMLNVIAAILAVFVAVSLLSAVGVYAYGRFARRSRGPASQSLPVEAGQTPLDRYLAPLTDAEAGRNGLLLSSENLQAFAARALSARNAGRSLDLQYYYWKDDMTGTLLAGEALAAADRGVRVRLLLDDINLRGKDAKYLSLDSHQNIEVRVFNPCWNRVGSLQRGFEVLLRAWSATRRMHNKVWIADGRVAIVGGRNIGDAYFDASQTMNFRDLDLVLIGPAIRDAETAFDAFWNSDCVLPIASLPGLDTGDLVRLRARIAEVAASPNAAPFLARVRRNDSVRALLDGTHPLHWSAEVEVVSDPPEKSNGDQKSRWLHKAIFPLVNSATQTLQITSPYFIPGSRGVEQLGARVKAGASVAVLTNSLAATDVAAVHGAYAPYRKALLRKGVALYELKADARRKGISLFGSSGASLHTKSFTVDGKKGFVGSFNFDPRSVSLNTEMGIIFEQPELCAEISELFRQQIAPDSSYRLTLRRRRLVWEDGRRNVTGILRSEPVAGWWRRLVATVIGWLPVESQL